MTRSDRRRGLGSDRGYALVLSLLILLGLSVLGLTLMTLGMSEVASSTNWRDYSKAFYAADGGLESGIVGLRSLLVSSFPVTSAQLATIAAPTLSSPGVSISSYSVQQVNATPYAMKFPTGPYMGLQGNATDFQITAQGAGNGGTGATLTQIFQYVQVPLFQFMVFYGNGVDLEISPGSNMTLTGPVFANSNIYLSPQGSTLQMNSTVLTSGNIYRTLKRSGVEGYGSNPQIMGADGNYHTLNFDHVDSTNFGGSWSAAQWKASALSTFGGNVRDSAMGVGQIIPPVPALFYNPSSPDQVAHQMIELPQSGDPAALKAAKLYTQANLRIVDGAATDQNGNPVTLPAGLISSTSFYDSREGQMMAATQVDVGVLKTWLASNPPGVSWNGVLYVASTTNGFGPTNKCANNPSLACPAVRLVNGANLPSAGLAGGSTAGLTVVSQNPVYIQGDFNTTASHPCGSSASCLPAAVMADAVTVLSNNWNDANAANSGSTLSSRVASTTTVNAAIATGPSNESSSGAGNGQVENDIRFLEDWSGGKTLNYSGSLVDLWHSMQVTKPWQNTGVYYFMPIRNWSFDTLFNTNPPKGTPMGVVMQKSRWTRS